MRLFSFNQRFLVSEISTHTLSALQTITDTVHGNLWDILRLSWNIALMKRALMGLDLILRVDHFIV